MTVVSNTMFLEEYFKSHEVTTRENIDYFKKSLFYLYQIFPSFSIETFSESEKNDAICSAG